MSTLDGGMEAPLVERLRAAGCVFAEEEAELLNVAAGTPTELAGLVRRRVAGEPLEQVLGWAEFCGLRISVTPGVFVPRRRSEFLVRQAVELTRRTMPPNGPTVVDLCCGSGALAVAFAAVLRPARLVAVDVDPVAVRCASRNLAPLGAVVLAGDLFTPLPGELRGHVDLLLANVPYVPTGEVGLLPAEARLHESPVALDGGPDGLDVLRRVAGAAGGWLAPGGWLLFEVSAGQADLAGTILVGNGLTQAVAHCAELEATVVIGQAVGLNDRKMGHRSSSPGSGGRVTRERDAMTRPDPRGDSVTSSGKTRVAVVFGGRSTEHAISCVSAGSILAALDPDEFEVIPIGITRAGQWVLTSADPAQFAITERRLPEITASAGSAVVLPADPTGQGLLVLDPADGPRVLADVDVVFPALHGAYGEDGTIQGLLEMAGIPYVGANVFASAAAMDKEFSKKLAVAEGIPVGDYVVLRSGMNLTEQDRERLGLPVFVKPSRAGSSYGISKVSDWSQLDAAVATARQIDSKVLIEAAIVGREIECGVLEGEAGGACEASVLAEVRVTDTTHDFYDFEAKYLGGCEYDIPAGLPERVTRQVREYACRTFTALDCAGLARVDFFVTPELDIYLNEINTMPGFTPTSMFPQMWAATGLEYPKLVDRLIRTALRRGTGLH